MAPVNACFVVICRIEGVYRVKHLARQATTGRLKGHAEDRTLCGRPWFAVWNRQPFHPKRDCQQCRKAQEDMA